MSEESHLMGLSKIRDCHSSRAKTLSGYTTQKECEWVNSLVYCKHYEYKRNGLWHVYVNGKPLKDKNGKAILYNYIAQPGTKGFDYKLNFKKQGKK